MSRQHTDPNWKGCPPRVQRIGIVDDDEAARKTLVELLEREFPSLTVRGFESLFSAYEGITTHDYLLIDVSSVCPSTWHANRAWAPIGKYAEQHPATEFVIVSAMSRNAIRDVIDDCVEYGAVARERLHVGGFMWDDIKATLHALIKPEDLVWTKCGRKK